ncbi:3,4-dihydroxy-2-butanone-4-phosphate synthase [Ferrimonas pelagia]|uniref:3,4-dihydroxy-2-butanone 4-phosphate synthase n=1 Tax=Ferrimonas pelagia TaxID=1177826 RepID=A0ABP9EPT0_9GAMM
MELNSAVEMIAAIRRGEMVVLLDEAQPGSEGALLMAAEKANAESINFMAHQARGLICLALDEARCAQLKLPLMAAGRSPNRLNFTVSIEAAEGVTTGISAGDRARTIEAAMAEGAGPADLVQPGHIFPVMAQPGGVMSCSAAPEAACDLTRLAGLKEGGVVVSILNDEGEVAQGEALLAFARQHGLAVGCIADLIHHRLLHEGTIRRDAQYVLPTKYGEFEVVAYEDKYKGVLHLALIKGEIEPDQPVLVRVQSAQLVRDLLGAHSDSGPEQWDVGRALQAIAEAGSGVLVLLAAQESPKAVLGQLARYAQPSAPLPTPPNFKHRTLGVGAQILRDLKVRRLRLLNDPVSFTAISGYDMEVEEFVAFGALALEGTAS